MDNVKLPVPLKQLPGILGARATASLSSARQIVICTDSRHLTKNCVFWAFRGETFDGHKFVSKALKTGSVAAVVDKKWAASHGEKQSPLIVVEDTRKAWLSLARHYSKPFLATKIALTGSNGKTTTKDMICTVLNRRGAVMGTAGNYNNDIGVPLTLFRLRKRHRFAVVEMGTNHPGEIRPLSYCVEPDIAIITNIGDSHLEHFKNRENVYKEKRTIRAGLKKDGILIVNADDAYLAKVRSTQKTKVTTFGIKKGDLKADDIQLDDTGCPSFQIAGVPFHIPVPGKHNVYNALAAVSAGKLCGITLRQAANRLKRFKSVKLRMEVISCGGVRIINDCYNANPSSVEGALQTLGRMNGGGKKIAVLGDMLELGSSARQFHKQTGALAASLKIHAVYSFGQHGAWVAGGARAKGIPASRAKAFKTREGLAKYMLKRMNGDEQILVKGSRGMRLERVTEALVEGLKLT